MGTIGDAGGTNGNLMGRWGATSYILGQVIGSGIFITPTGILNNVHSVGASLLIWLVSGLISILGALCYLELGTSIRKSGCDFAYLCHMRWVALAFTFMTCVCIFMGPGSLAIQAQTFTEYFIRGLKLEFCDPFVRSAAHKLITFSVLLLLFVLNCFSISGVVSRFQIISMIAKVAACTIIVVMGALFWLTQGVRSNNFNVPFDNSNFAPGKVVLALFSGLFSYGGWEILNNGIEDVEHPHRTMPFAIIFGMSIVIVLYMTINISYFVVLSVPEMQRSNAIAMVSQLK
uniref:AA_permease domain-containing protein n=1 Tax=Globodera pallida TaxID=36090 RepID=A0A183CEA0_GLOPA